jgi:Transposase IS116/IS110/IS902 family
LSAPGIGWVLAFTIAAEIGAIKRFESPYLLSPNDVGVSAAVA